MGLILTSIDPLPLFRFIRVLQDGLEKLLQRRQGFRGKLQEIIRASRIAEEIGRYRIRIHELRSNFLV